MQAEREVILSAGGYDSPQLLMLSGIGPAADLAAVQIERAHDLRSAEPAGPPAARLRCLTDEEQPDHATTPESFVLLRRGPRPVDSNVGEAGFRSHPGRPEGARRPVLHRPSCSRTRSSSAPPFDHAYAFGPAVVKPTSRGQVTLRSPVPHAQAADPAQLPRTEEDRRSMIAGVRLTWR